MTVSNSPDADQARRFVGSDLDPNPVCNSHQGNLRFIHSLHDVQFYMTSVAIFSNLTHILKKRSFRYPIRVSNSSDPDQARRLIGSDLDPYC